MELILRESIRVNQPSNDDDFGAVVSIDTTVQEKILPIRQTINWLKKTFKIISKSIKSKV